MQKQRIATLLSVLALAVVAAIVGWLAGSTIQSPAEAAARTAPPTPAPILVPVEARVLTSDIVTRGTARYGLPKALALAPSALKIQSGVITTLPARGDQVEEGDLLLTASGRPVFVLAGETPVYRDLVPGIFGDDVRQFEEAIQRLGVDPGPPDGVYDEKTSQAVADWYTAKGWSPLAPSSAQQTTVQTIEQALAVARNQQAAAAAVIAAAPLMIEEVSARADLANKTAFATLAAQESANTSVRADAAITPEAHTQAQAALEMAQAAVQATQLQGAVAIQAALDAQKAAERAAKLADELVARLADDLALAQRRVGIPMPADEMVFIPELPVRIEEVTAAVGDAAHGPLLTVTNNQLAIDSSLPLDEAQFIQPGMAVVIDEPDLNLKATGTVARVAATPGTDGVDGFHFYFETRVNEALMPIEGFSLRLTIPVKSTGGAVNVVPLSALSLAADGTSRVQISNGGALEFVVVEPGLSADGFVEVTPVDGALTTGQLVVVGYENQE